MLAMSAISSSTRCASDLRRRDVREGPLRCEPNHSALGRRRRLAGLFPMLLALVIELTSHDPERRHCERGLSSWSL
jgi:hypothetical protein